MQDFIISLFEPYNEYSKLQIALEIIAVVLGVASVFFSMRRNILVFPTGIISTSIYIYILFAFGLLGEGLIQVYYRSEEHTSELQSRENLVCRLLLENKKKQYVMQDGS